MITAADIGGEGIANDQHARAVFLRNAGKYIIKKALLRLLKAGLFRNKYAVKSMGERGALQPAVLHPPQPVRHQIEAVFRPESINQLQSAGKKICALAEVADIGFIRFNRGGASHPRGVEEVQKTLNFELILCDLA